METKDLQSSSQEEQVKIGEDTENTESKSKETLVEKEETNEVQSLELSESDEKKDSDTNKEEVVKSEDNTEVSNTEKEVTESESDTEVSDTKEGANRQVQGEKILDVDYSILSKREMLDKLEELLNTKSVSKIKDVVEKARVSFYKRHKIDVAEANKRFIEEGGKPEDFKYKDELEERFKVILKTFREKKAEFNRNIEQEKEINLKTKFKIIEEIKTLINRKESIDKTFQEFRELQKKWRDVGLVPQSAVKNLWETYHHHVENFYDYININKELRDLDLKKNLAMKINICEDAEKLLLESSVIKAFNTLQKFHEQWREIGPAPKDKKDELWNRFKEATTLINKKHQSYYENIKVEQKKNLEAKAALCEKVEELTSKNIENHKDWNASSKGILELQKVWRTIGFAPKKDNNLIYQRFRKACDIYFDRKRNYYLQLKEELNNNLQLKLDLCIQVEALQDCTEWKKTTDELIAIQKRWKEIGPAPRKVSDEVWTRFRTACDKFFNKKSDHFGSMDSDQVTNLKLKQDILEQVESFKPSDNNENNIKRLRHFQKEWSDVGHVPYKQKDKIQKDFRNAINKHFDSLDLDEHSKETQRFKNKIDSYLEQNRSEDKIMTERSKIANKIKQSENDIIIWENNIGFFSNSKKSELIVKDIREKIEKGKENLKFLKEKLRIIDNLS